MQSPRPPKHPTLLEINTRVWLKERSIPLGRPATLDDVGDAYLDGHAQLGVEWLWMMGVWQTGPAARAVSREDARAREDYERTLPDFTIDDVIGSPFAVREYHVDESLGGDAALERLRHRLRSRGLRLMLDFVPNHTAPDHPWVAKHPEYYINGNEADLRDSPDDYASVTTASGPRILARGKDPYSPVWRDVLQLNYRSVKLRAAMLDELQRIAAQCDGLRCDMAMLLLPEVIQQTWGERARPADDSPAPDESFWPEAIARVQEVNRQFIFMAEVYWDREWELQQQGFHYCYDKRLYDRLRLHETEQVRSHLRAGLDFQNKVARFLENHDEPRAAIAFPGEIGPAAAIATYFTPGLRFFHEGQLEGRRTRVSMHVGRRPPEPLDGAVREFYEKLFALLKTDAVREGSWRLLDSRPVATDNRSNAHYLAYSWEGLSGDRLFVVVNYSEQRSQAWIEWPWSGDQRTTVSLQDRFSDVSFERSGDELVQRGMFFDEPGWKYYVFEVESD